ncbi:hypothetical protein CWC25_02130 [Pseudoalteromonas sp. S4389]|uniref:terminase gpP N-terminus-related DNA-binding protein n=1 Tax=unclassified Pseudoalteromonas TaxID=194690 RepID=UPI001108264C|nr:MULTISPECIES: sigma-70 family RNA polymerase sigma factor [unclassified Pseudoalteromonas]MCF2900115.1 sigma-70 family RNA polymerase sigma factor [Pseudoalteromonas sp. OFAV1]TMO47070.1 hypothetical protein CWC25_02130 [Pseudoalteromonas sp. S4389]
MFFSGIQNAINAELFSNMPIKDQNTSLQNLYDKGYSVPEISKKIGIQSGTIYKRIDAHRGRKGLFAG